MFELLFLVILITCVQSEFNPYVDNGGTILSIAGKRFCLFAADTRLIDQYMIRSRHISRIFQIDEGTLLSSSGCWSDIIEVVVQIQKKLHEFETENDVPMSIRQGSQLLSIILYSRRGFPYYAFNIIGGIDQQTGNGVLYNYDALGSFEQVRCYCNGRGQKYIQPMLDKLSQPEDDSGLWKLSSNHDQFETNDQGMYCNDLDIKSALQLVTKAFQVAAEREISVGDSLEVWILQLAEESTPIDDVIGLLSEERTQFQKENHGKMKRPTNLFSNRLVSTSGKVTIRKFCIPLPLH